MKTGNQFSELIKSSTEISPEIQEKMKSLFEAHAKRWLSMTEGEREERIKELETCYNLKKMIKISFPISPQTNNAAQ